VASIFLSSAVHAAPATCPQFDYLQELPPVPADPKLILNADRADFSENGISTLTGSVHVSQNGREFAAEQLEYNEADAHILTHSESIFRDNRLAIRSNRTDYDLKLGSGVFLDNRFTLREISGRGESQRLVVSKDGVAHLEGVRYTTCAPGDEAWTLSADEITLKHEEGIGTARNAVLRFQHVPLFYLPYFQFPIDGLRHSGFLFPIVGNNNTNGFDIRVPFYLNLGPNYDATLIPRYLSERGEQIGGRFRYLFRSSQGGLFGEFLPNDDKLGGAERSYLDFEHQGRLTPRFGLEAKYGEVSDRNYFANFGGGVDLTSTPFLERGATLTYQAPTNFRIQAQVQDYQILTAPTSDITTPYQRLPQIRLNALTKNSYFDARAGLDGEFTNFARANSVEGQRFIAQPYLRWEKDRAAWFASAQADLSYTAYNLTDTAPGQAAEPRRTLPLFNAEGGLRFERLNESGRLQTLEPHLYYLYVPYRDQSTLPLFDSGLPDFDFPQLFARNRYSGQDRISDANQLTSALTTRLIEPTTGVVRLKATIGQVYYIRNPRVNLPGFDTPTTGSSDYLANIEYQITSHWSASATAEVRPEFDRLTRTAFDLRYRDPQAGEAGKRLDLAYRYRNGLLEQADASFSAPITSAWRLAGRVRYSLRDNSTLEAFGGIEYQTCCWAISTTYRRYLSGSTIDRFNNGFYIQLELKGLTRIGNGFERLLPTEDFVDAKRRIEKQ
jgi:LPS-assembly protein